MKIFAACCRNARRAAIAAAITTESLIAEVEQVKQLAIKQNQLPAAVAAIKEKGEAQNRTTRVLPNPDNSSAYDTRGKNVVRASQVC
jgi:hypothetical protein